MSPMLVTLLGIVIDVKLLQPEYLQLIVYQFVLIKTVEKWLSEFYREQKRRFLTHLTFYNVDRIQINNTTTLKLYYYLQIFV